MASSPEDSIRWLDESTGVCHETCDLCQEDLGRTLCGFSILTLTACTEECSIHRSCTMCITEHRELNEQHNRRRQQ